MAPLVFPDIVRYSVVGECQGEECVNVFDIKIERGPAAPPRSEEIERVAGDLLNQWGDHVLPALSDSYTANEVRYVDLNSLDGISGTLTTTDDHSWPADGEETGPPLPNNVYAKMVKQLDSHSRQARNGLTRLGGISEAATSGTNGNQIQDSYRLAYDTAFESMRDGINGTDGTVTVNMGVLHTVEGVATGFTFIASFSCALTVGTIRRRMPGYGS